MLPARRAGRLSGPSSLSLSLRSWASKVIKLGSFVAKTPWAESSDLAVRDTNLQTNVRYGP
jgi:hypothetical protein